jgi:spermidine/putrescine-binding protein
MPARTIRLIVALAAAFFAALAPSIAAQAQKPDVLIGTWDVKMEDGSREFVWEFMLKDGKLAGKFSGASGASEMANLTFENNTVKFSVTVGNGMVIDFSAIVAEDKLTGMLSLEYGEAAITGAKRK